MISFFLSEFPMISKKRWLSMALLLVLNNSVTAGEREDLTQLHDTTMNLIKLLVQEGVLSKDKADALIKQAERGASSTAATTARAPENAAKAPSDVVRVPYVPQIVRDQIRDEVKRDVLAQAKTERWGDPGALPDWLSRVTWSGDLRVRAESDFFQSSNYPFVPNYVAINQAGNLNGANTYLNTTTDRRRWLLRARLGMNAQVSDKMKIGVRVSSGTTTNPVSTNSTLGSFQNRSAVVLDQAYLSYQPAQWLQLQAGKMPNPWLSTDLVWDDDVNFDGVAASFAHSSGRLKTFATLGAFPVQEVDFSTSDKWLYAGQIGVDFQGTEARRARLGLAYYDYKNMAGVVNQPAGTRFQDFTAPVFAQKGNTYYNIANDPSNVRYLYGLASDYRLINVTGIFDVATFGRARVTLTGDYVKNIGFDENRILQRSGLVVGKRDQGYLGKLTVGMPEIKERSDWQVFGAYRYLEGDAVPDAFTDSDFHLGGTNAKGWILGGSYGLEHNTWLTMRWMSADNIDNVIPGSSPPVDKGLGIDVLQLDLNTKF